MVDEIQTDLTGYMLLNNPHLNKGSAFPQKERDLFKLNGLLPHDINTLEQQCQRAYQQYNAQPTTLLKNGFLQSLLEQNEVLFYRLLLDHLTEMLPVIYTPTEADVIKKYSYEFRRPRGVYLTFCDHNDQSKMEELLSSTDVQDADLVVVSDAEEILGIGDQGVGGIGISVAKCVLYTLMGGVHPLKTLPVVLDVGTNNKELLDDPLYMGWRHPRVTGEEYDKFVDTFVQAARKAHSKSFLHWEDFGRDNARRLLEHYKDDFCTFNDDIQGTGAVTLAGIIAALEVTDTKLKDQKVVIFGAGTAGMGIADQVRDAMVRDGLSKEEATSKIWCIDKEGLITENLKDKITPAQKSYVRKDDEISSWKCKENPGLLETVKNVHPTILIGTSTVPKAFTEEVVKEMTSHCDRPIIFPLSNPTKLVEADPADICKWSEGKALIATGSPFPPVKWKDESRNVAECNNALVYPGIGLAMVTCRPEVLTDEMLWAAVLALSNCSPIKKDKKKALLPDIEDIRKVSQAVAVAVIKEAEKKGLATVKDDKLSIEDRVKKGMWNPEYHPLIPKKK